MTRPDQRPPMAVAVEWVSRITTVSLEIVVLAWGGRMLDDRLGTTYLALVGLVLGLLIGHLHLFQMVGIIGSSKDRSQDANHSKGD